MDVWILDVWMFDVICLYVWMFVCGIFDKWKKEATRKNCIFVLMRKRLLNILFWSVISAAFIGPGTITTAAKAGAEFGFSLLWALVFSTIACLVLQEAAARLSILSGKSLGNAIAQQYKNKKAGWLIFALVIGAIILGSAAYQTGNLLGAAEGIRIFTTIPTATLVLVIGVFAFIALLFPGLKVIARTLGFLVVLMGIAFLYTAVVIKPDMTNLIQGAITPSFPKGSGLLLLGLVGTTVVPYNLFLGSGIADKKQSLVEMRWDISVAIILGGIISMAVLVTGTAVNQSFSFLSLGRVLGDKLGNAAVWLFGFGLFAAGFSSAVTAPLASAITAKDLFEKNGEKKWQIHGLYFKLTWMFVLFTGLGFGMAGFKPIPAIVTAQALNGLILPFVSIFLWMAINDRKLVRNKLNSLWGNLLFGLVVWVSLLLGSWNILRLIVNINTSPMDVNSILLILLSLNFIFTLLLWFLVIQKRRVR